MSVTVTKANLHVVTGPKPGVNIYKANLHVALDPNTPGPAPSGGRRRQMIIS